MTTIYNKSNYNIENLINIINSEEPKRIAITGAVHVGKTTELISICSELKSRNYKLSGFFEIAIFENGQHIGYDFLDVNGENRCTVARKENENSQYTFCDLAWTWAHNQLLQLDNSKILIIDELGRLEANGQGLMPALLQSLKNTPRHIIASVREDVIKKIENQIGMFDQIIKL